MKTIALITLSGLELTLVFAVTVFSQEVAVPGKNASNRSGKIIVGHVVNEAAKTFMEDPHAVGLSIGLYKDGKTYTYNYGEIERETRREPTADTFYEIGSITKAFTGTLLARAVAEGKVGLEDDIRKYLDGDYPNLEYKGNPIRLVHLINHLSGLPFSFYGKPGSSPNYAEIEKNYTRRDFYNDLKKFELVGSPGEKFQYSNAAAQLLGHILERVYGMSYEELIKTKIAKPLKMNSTRIGLTSSDIRRSAKGYDEKGSVVTSISERSQAAGALRSTVADMLKYIRWHLAEKDESSKLSHRPTWPSNSGNYSVGLGWQMITEKNYRKIWQSGGLPGFTSYCAFYPELDFGIVVLTNEEDRSSRIEKLVNQIMETIGQRTAAKR